jgi:hypothetical protein
MLCKLQIIFLDGGGLFVSLSIYGGYLDRRMDRWSVTIISML